HTLREPLYTYAATLFSSLLGGLTSGSGLALGIEYRKSRMFVPPLDFRAKAVGSVKKYELLETGFALPRLAGNRLFAEIGARYRNFPEEDFWGLGPDTQVDRRTAFRLEDFDVSAVFGARLFKPIEAGITAGRTWVNTGTGRDHDWPSIEQRFTPGEVPALAHQPDYSYWGAFALVDRRDQPDDPRRGGLYEARWTSFRDLDSSIYDFHRYEVDLRHFLPALRERDTIAVRAHTTLSQKRDGRQVPFYLQPTVGGGEARGYDPSRFRDENALVFNLEYRWRIREMFQAVGFADAGRVFHRPGQIGLAGLRTSVGGGGRLKLGDRILVGFDIGWSPEGLHIRFRSAHAF
ncbi:MAG: hypothetical protein ACE141_18130, partial [Bryobacteraceae bacterium]